MVIGSRGSLLALTQTKFIQSEILRIAPEIETSIEIIKTSADKDLLTSLRSSGGAGLFVKELEQSLLRGEIDLAVHSMKDVPTAIAEGLRITSVPEREDARDALIVNQPTIKDIPFGARVGTGSFRRQAQLLALRPDLRILDIRGNVDTRIKKMNNGECDAIVLATAGLRRLGLQNLITYTLSLDEMLPAPGQGALAVETRVDDVITNKTVEKLNHLPTALSVAAERDILERLGGGCNVPIAIYARVNQGALEIDALVAAPDGERVVRDKISGDPGKSVDVCAALSDRILAAGGREILHDFRN